LQQIVLQIGQIHEFVRARFDVLKTTGKQWSYRISHVAPSWKERNA